jgi:ABC-type Fe3+ transport system substrate-binding protein
MTSLSSRSTRQYLFVFSAGIVTGSQQMDAGQRLIHFLGSEAAEAAIAEVGWTL